MKSFAIAAAVIAAIACQAETARAAECVTFASGEILCDDGSYAYYWSPAANEWQVLDREATAAALGLSTGSGTGGSAAYGSDGSSLTTTDEGCMMYSAPGYSYGDSLSFSSGC
jgi:hypothetical protein